ncbi:MlaA family lipoprotein [Geothermobacter hydrogeniphilus]|uniref:Phospholipid-binding lipoprotein MlaA n=1 Tax=Geothermobacter hydrogeniphilus TaxID=1969733 RepID=A0A1X0Y647_9BACT|nr:VacJ family lipoprotein [Geothermobacter hydrogeniphilus]ORJ60625.1 hypothetical protein B5V00_07260 [Geothermobacter hydrogeniphilus]
MTTKMTRMLIGLMLLTLLALCGCSTAPKTGPDTQPPLRTLENTVGPNMKPAATISDPFEGFNRGAYRFNYYFDKYLFLPVISGYQFIMPDYAEDRVSNFFDNIYELDNFTNSVLQLKFKKAAITTERFFINTVFGIGGLWDVATHLGVHRQNEDFGQTMGHYGVGHGPYLVLPVFGPSNLRDATGIAVDGLVFDAIDPLNFENNDLDVPFYLLYAIDTRKRVDFRYYGSGNPFEYELIRFLYTKKRELEIAD